MDNMERDSYLERINDVFERREMLLKKREEEHEKQKATLSAMLGSLKAERAGIEKEREDLAKEREALDAREEELNRREEMLESWHKEETEARRELEEKRRELDVKMRLELEETRNEKLCFLQMKEEFTHKLELMGLLSEQEGNSDPGELFRELLSGAMLPGSDIRKENEELRARLAETEEAMEEHEEEILRFEEERKRLLEMIAKLHPASSVSERSQPGAHEAEESSGEEKEEESGQSKGEGQDEAREDVTAPILKKYMEKNEEGYDSMEIRHSEAGEQLHVSKNGLDQVYIFSDPAFFEISAERKDSRSLQKVLAGMNEKWPGVQFRYEDGRAYATGFFSTDISPGRLLERVGRISEECFEQRKAS